MIQVNKSKVTTTGIKPTIRTEFIMLCQHMTEEVETIEEFIEDIEDSFKTHKELHEENLKLMKELIDKIRGLKNETR